MGIELPKKAKPARYKVNSYSVCAKEPLVEKVFKVFFTYMQEVALPEVVLLLFLGFVLLQRAFTSVFGNKL